MVCPLFISLGELIGKSDQAVARWEKGGKVPDEVGFLVRHIYKQTVIDPRTSYIEMVDELRAKDMAFYNHELAFRETQKGWDKAA